MSKAQVGVWHCRFHSSDMSVKDKPRPGHPCSMSTPAQKAELQAAIDQDRRSSIRDLSEKCYVNRNMTHKIVKKDFKMKKVTPKFIPRVLMEEMKKMRRDLSAQNLQLFKDDPQLLSKIITGDESYFPLFDIETKLELQWKTAEEPCPTKALRNRSEKKTMLMCFFDEHGLIQTEFRPVGDAVNAENYVQLLKRLKERIHKKDLFCGSDKILMTLNPGGMSTSIKTMPHPIQQSLVWR